ncbi:MAG: hypothetical protein B6242_17060 [Anaerolineaceae bacterium 4572_78]|nr:MAG: hypothetical protein B6242_17060 [Anaerolineaceae bacterium 4572_78]
MLKIIGEIIMKHTNIEEKLKNYHVMSSNYVGNIYRDDEIAEIFTDKMRISGWLKVLVALAKCQSEHGIVPKEATAIIAENAELNKINLAYLHIGSATQDIQDTEQSMALKKILNIFKARLDKLRADLVNLGETHLDTVCMGRTHYQPAVPITFGFKVASWIDELDRNLQRLDEVISRIAVVQIYGACGSASHLGVDIELLEKGMAERLGLNRATFAWHTVRDRIHEFLFICSMICTNLSRIANELTHLNRPEIAEIELTWEGGMCSSTIMPHKRNPEEFEHVITLSHLVHGNLSGYLNAPQAIHERDFIAVRMEWAIIPETASYTGKAIDLLTATLPLVKVNKEAMQHNVEKFAVKLSSEKLMIQLGQKMGKINAHKLLVDVFESVAHEDKSVLTFLKEHAEINNYLDEEMLEAIFNPINNIGQSQKLAQRVFAWQNRQEVRH